MTSQEPAIDTRKPLPAEPFEIAIAPVSARERFSIACRGPLLGLLVNIILVIVKVIAAIASGSVALLADAGHSGADIANNILVLGSLFYASRPADESH